MNIESGAGGTPEESASDHSDHDSPADMAARFTGGSRGWSAVPLGPVNWNLLTADEAEAEWLDLNAWVNWLRRAYGLPASVVPPFWHRHDELVWELSALHQHWLNCYDPDGSPSGPIGWHRDFADARHRLREWVATSGTKLDRDRPTRHTTWPGEEPIPPSADTAITDREADFVQFVLDDVAERQRIEQHAAHGRG